MQWLLFSRCPLTIEAVAEALAFSRIEEQEDLRTEIGNNELSDPSDILYMCSSLVKTVHRQHMWQESSEAISIVEYDSDISLETSNIYQEHRWDEENQRGNHSASIKGEAMHFLQLAHASVKDYLLSSSSTIGSGTISFSLSSNMVLAETCITYLLQFSFWGAVEKNFRHDKPLALYAARFWSESLSVPSYATLGERRVQDVLIFGVISLRTIIKANLLGQAYMLVTALAVPSGERWDRVVNNFCVLRKKSISTGCACASLIFRRSSTDIRHLSV